MNDVFSAFADQRNQLLKNRHQLMWDEEETERKFNFVSAELLNFLPDISFSDHRTIFENIIVNVKLNKLEQEYPFVLGNVLLENFSKDTESYIRNNPCIFCAWHFGAYKLINHFIAQNKIPYCLVISKQILQSEGSDFLEKFNKIYNDSESKSFQIIDAEAPNAGLSILRQIKKGYSILFYIDGNTGTGSTRDCDNNCCIDFLKNKIFARKGIAFLSHLSKTPILPIISYRESIDKIIFHFHELIFPELQMDRNEFALNCTQRLYDLFASSVKTHPDQWEAWLYLYKVLKNGDMKMEQVELKPDYFSKKIIFNSCLFGIYRWKESFYLFNKKHFISFPINQEIYHFFKGSASVNLNIDQLDGGLFNELYKNQVLICSN